MQISILLTVIAITTSLASAFMPSSSFRHTTVTPTTTATQLDAKVIVVSPPGGVGEVTAVKTAEEGNDVRWFVVSQDSTKQVALAPSALKSIEANGGSVQLAGADVPGLLLSPDDPSSAVPAVSKWCSAIDADAIVCCYDGVEQLSSKKRKPDQEDPQIGWKNAIKVAAREASKQVTSNGMKIAILSASDMEDIQTDDDDKQGKDEGGFLGGLFKGKVDIPKTLAQAMSTTTNNNNNNIIIKLRHGSLFGIPESSPEFSIFVGGPKKEPELCQEYTMRSIRVDPTLSVSGNLMMGTNTRTSRHAVGQAAALMISNKISIDMNEQQPLDVCVSSQPGTDMVDIDEWQKEFQRIERMMKSGEAAQLFSTEFASVPDTERLANWLNEKWAPAILRTYDIAAIRTGARPVYAKRAGNDNDGKVEIIWQQLVNFDSVTVGKMLIQVTDTGLSAVRAPGDASKGFGSISQKPLPGEDVLVRRLAEAASQAVEKGLAKKASPKTVKVKDVPKAVPTTTPTPVTSIQSSGDVAPVTSSTPSSSSESGPRQPGARRPTERKRRKTKQSPPKE